MAKRVILGVLAAMSSLVVASCGGDQQSARTLVVPSEFATIQQAVDEADPGDVIEIEAGIYKESVVVSTDDVVIQGADRNAVILDGEHRRPNGILVAANRVSVQNLTIHSYTQNGLVFNGIQGATNGGAVDPNVVYGTDGRWIDGYHVSHVTTYNNGLYGIYAFASTNGTIEDSYASGHPDSGIYVGQCNPCNAVVQRVLAESNAIGYYGTNASGNVFVINSTFRNNRLGIAPNSQEAEKLAPQRGTYVGGNRVESNNNADAPHIPDGAFGIGIAVGGGTQNVISRNLVIGHKVAGIAVMTLGRFRPENNRIEENRATNNAVDIAYANTGDEDLRNNCFEKNDFKVSLPQSIEQLMPCGVVAKDLPQERLPVVDVPPPVDYKLIKTPPLQPTMTEAEKQTKRIFKTFVLPEISDIKVPSR